MASIKEPILWIGTVMIVVLVVNKGIAYVRMQQAMSKNGCQPPPKYPHRDPFLGLDMFFDQFSAMKRGDVGKTERERFRKYGKTFQANSWGTRCIHTMEPLNMQAVLAQSFDHFGVEPMRLHVGEPLIGKGVFSTDGAYWRFSRELIKPIFARVQVADLSAIDLYLDQMLGRIPRDGTTIDIQALLKLMVCLYASTVCGLLTVGSADSSIVS